MKKKLLFYSLMCLLPSCVHAQKTILKEKKYDDSSWTWFHRKQFSAVEQEENGVQTTLKFAKKGLPSFTQLVFSWNALRPAKGHFTFYAQVRNAQTKEWSKFHKMVSWGADVQKSFNTEADRISSYHHVRLESAQTTTADAFSIAIKAENGADLSLLKSFGICLSDFNEFRPEDESIITALRSLHIKGVPQFSQFELNHPRNDGLCSPTSCAMLLGYLTGQYIDPINFAENSLDTGLDKYGSWPFSMARAYEESQLYGNNILFSVRRLPSFVHLYKHLSKGIPVVVSVRGHIKGAPKPYLNGHLLVVIGLDAKKKEIICHDPAVASASECKKRYPIKSFLQAWERSHRLAYLADPLPS